VDRGVVSNSIGYIVSLPLDLAQLECTFQEEVVVSLVSRKENVLISQTLLSNNLKEGYDSTYLILIKR